jgi:hypothetical protein
MALQKTLAMLLQFLMFTLVTAAPIVTEGHHGNTWQYGAGGGVVGFIVLILDIIVFSKSLNAPTSLQLFNSPPCSTCPCYDFLPRSQTESACPLHLGACTLIRKPQSRSSNPTAQSHTSSSGVSWSSSSLSSVLSSTGCSPTVRHTTLVEDTRLLHR